MNWIFGNYLFLLLSCLRLSNPCPGVTIVGKLAGSPRLGIRVRTCVSCRLSKREALQCVSSSCLWGQFKMNTLCLSTWKGNGQSIILLKILFKFRDGDFLTDFDINKLHIMHTDLFTS
jgi:hypothetical protein